MTVSLGGITLSDELVLHGLESAQMIATSVTHTLGGSAVVQYDPMDQETGLTLTLESKLHLSLADIQAVRALVGQEVALVHHRGTYQVVVVNTPDEPAVAFRDPAAEDFYSGEITMITV